MDVCVDTSALLALRVPTDAHHAEALEIWDQLDPVSTRLFVSQYARLETYSLLHRRLGLSAVRGFREAVAPLLRVLRIDDELHQRALDVVLAGGRRGPSLTDAATFEAMQRAGIRYAFAFDVHFEAAGFELLASG